MTSSATHAPITVGVSGEEHAALAYAVIEARRLAAPLRLVHAIDHPLMPWSAAESPVSHSHYDETAHHILNRAGDGVRALSEGDVQVEQVVRRGPAAHVLVDESSTSGLLVLEHRALSRLARVFTGSTSTAVAARAHCPVVSVPEGWKSEGEAHVVVVGVDEAAEPASALRAAFEEARTREAVLIVLQAWRLDAQYEDVALVTGAEQEWRDRTQPVVEKAVEQCQQKRPGVKTTIDLRYSQPADTLAEASKEADLLVLGQRTRHGPLRIGSIARALIRVSHCPVMIVPVGEHSDGEEWRFDADEISPET